MSGGKLCVTPMVNSAINALHSLLQPLFSSKPKIPGQLPLLLYIVFDSEAHDEEAFECKES